MLRSLCGGPQCSRACFPRRRVLFGGLAGAAIAALDLGVVARRVPAIRELPTAPQWADHILFGATVGAVLEHRAP